MPVTTQQPRVTRFDTVPGLRRAKVFQLCLKLVVSTVGLYVLLQLASGRPLFPVRPLLWVALVVGTLLVCRMRVGWGTAVVFQDSAVVFFRGPSAACLLQRNTIRSIQRTKHSLVFRYQGDLGSRRKVVGSEGFPKDVWLALCEHASGYVSPASKT